MERKGAMHLQYGEVRQAHFLERPNRFIAHVELEGETVVCHVKNTGRCRELLVPGATVYLERGTNPARRTAWDLIAVEKGRVIAAGWSGKVKTASTMVCICLMLFGIPHWLNLVCQGIILVTTVYSGVEYFVKNWDVFSEK